MTSYQVAWKWNVTLTEMFWLNRSHMMRIMITFLKAL